MNTQNAPEKPAYLGLYNRFFKRGLDLLLSLVFLLFALPIYLLISLAILMEDGAPVFYRPLRGGYRGKSFRIYKFRTMHLLAEQDGPRWAKPNDSRSTRLGRALRHAHLDELPQLINIIAGQMSFVGPRPERPEFYDVFDTYIDGFRQRMLVTPGLTGLAQVHGGYELLPEEKIIYDLEYIKNRSFSQDLHCIFLTFGLLITHKGAR